MAYSDPLDPATPSDSSLASEGDDRIRELKRALIERFMTILVDIDADPWIIAADAVEAGLFDVGVGPEEDRPNPATYKFWLSSDTKRLWVNHLGTYVVVEGSTTPVPTLPNGSEIKRAVYNADSASGSMVSGFSDTSRIVTLYVSGTTDGIGELLVDLDEIEAAGYGSSGEYEVGNLFGLHAELVTSTADSGANVVAFAYQLDNDANTIRITVANAASGTTINAKVVTVFLTMIFGS